jgi:PDZ domain
MKHPWTVWASSAACFFLFLPCFASGQQDSQLQWQGGPPSASLLQSRAHPDSSQKPTVSPAQSPAVDHQQQSSAAAEQPSRLNNQPAVLPSPQGAEEPTAQKEIPAAWSQTPPPVNTPGYLGLSGRDFYREHFCLHALTIQAVEVAAVVPGGPAERAGLRAARALTGREVAAATVAGLLTLSPAAPWAAKVLQASGGVDHGDLILAVGGKRVTTQAEFERALAGFGPQAVVYLTVRRGDTVFQLPVRLDDWPVPSLSPPLQEANAGRDH